MKKQSFIQGTLILVSLSFVAKFLGIFFKVPLDFLVGTKGLGIYNILYHFYTSLLAISTVGLNTSVSKLVAERISLNKISDAYKVFKVSILLFTIMGILGSLIIFFLSKI